MFAASLRFVAIGMFCEIIACAQLFEVTRVVQDGQEVKVGKAGHPGDASFALTESPGILRFEITPNVHIPPVLRWRYQLEGVDSEWRDQNINVRVTVRFLDQEGRMIAGREPFLNGETPGWRGAVEAQA